MTTTDAPEMATYCLAADIRMPNSSLESDKRRPERVSGGDSDLDMVGATLIRRTWRARERATEISDVSLIAHWLCEDLGLAVRVDISELLCDTAGSIGSHRASDGRLSDGKSSEKETKPRKALAEWASNVADRGIERVFAFRPQAEI